MKKVIIYTVLIAVAIILSLIFSVPVVNDRIAYEVMNELKKTPLPQNTVLCDSLSMAGKLNGNGNGMQYFGAILIRSDLNTEELNNFYEQYRKNEWSYVVEEQCNTEISIVEHYTLEFSFLSNINEIEKYFIVYSWGESTYPLSGLDLRGH